MGVGVAVGSSVTAVGVAFAAGGELPDATADEIRDRLAG